MDLYRSTRREFIKHTALGVCAAALPAQVLADSPSAAIPKRPLGSTGVQVSILGLGGYHLGTIRDDAVAVRLIRSAIDRGVTFMDNAWEYHHGRSERLMGKALENGYRDKVFIMTKHHGRDKKTAMRHLDESLKRLKTDVIDLWQFHEVIYPDDPQMIFAPGGGIEAAEAAKKAGKVKFIGFTGHKDPGIHREMLRRDYSWDAVQMPINAFDPHFKSFQLQVLPELQRRGIGVIGMKSMGAGHLLKTGLLSPQEALAYAFSQPLAVVVSGIDSDTLLRKNAAVAGGFTPLSQKSLQQLRDRVKSAAEKGRYELFKTTRRFDGWYGRELHSKEG